MISLRSPVMTSSGELCLLHRGRRGLGEEGIHWLQELVNDRVETASPCPSFYLTPEEEGEERRGRRMIRKRKRKQKAGCEEALELCHFSHPATPSDARKVCMCTHMCIS